MFFCYEMYQAYKRVYVADTYSLKNENKTPKCPYQFKK